MTGALVDELRLPRDRRSIGASAHVAAHVLAAPERFVDLIDAMLDDDPLVRMRAADAAEKVTRRRTDLLAPHTERLLEQVALVPQHEVRWHVAQLLPRLPLTATQRDRAIDIVAGYLDDPSRIVQSCALQALVELAATDPQLRDRAHAHVHRLAAHGSPAVRARARHLLDETRPAGRGTRTSRPCHGWSRATSTKAAAS